MSKKVTKKATERNRNKRRLRAIFQSLMADDRHRDTFSRYHMLIIVHRSIEALPHLEVVRDAESLVRGLAHKPQA